MLALLAASLPLQVQSRTVTGSVCLREKIVHEAVPFFTRRSLPVGENKGEPCSMPAVKSCRLRPLARAVHPLFAMSLLLCSPAWADEPVRRTYSARQPGAALTRFADQAGVSLAGPGTGARPAERWPLWRLQC